MGETYYLMEYFYIASSIASLLGFIGYLFDRITNYSHQGVTYWLIGTFFFLTIIFWGWFYFIPDNPVRGTIEERIHAIRNFESNNGSVDIVEAMFIAKGFEGTIFLPPFEEPPEVFLKRPSDDSYYGSYQVPEIKVTTDTIHYRYNNSDLDGKWIYRARGKLLTLKHEHEINQ